MDASTYGRTQLRQLLYDLLYKNEPVVTIPCRDHAEARSLQNRINKLRAFERKAHIERQRKDHERWATMNKSSLPPLIDDSIPLDNLTIKVAAGDSRVRIHNGKEMGVSLHSLVVVEEADGTERKVFPEAEQAPEAPAPDVPTAESESPF